MTEPAMATATVPAGEGEETQLETETEIKTMILSPSPEQQEEHLQLDQPEPAEPELPEPESDALPPAIMQTESTDSTDTNTNTNDNDNANKNNADVKQQTTKPTSTYSTMKQYTKGPGRRLVEYFVVVSSLPRKDSSDPVSPNISFQSQFDEIPQNISIEDYEDIDNELNFEPIITARYPKTDHHGNPLHQSVACFCHPAGIIQLKSKPSMPKIHYFVMTGGRGKQMYGVCLTIHEPFSIKVKSSSQNMDMYIPKCICILSAYPYLVAFREYLTQLDRIVRKGDMKIPVERYITNFCAEVPAPPPGSFEVQTTIADSVIKIWSPPNNQPIPWVSLPFSHLFECLDIDNIITAWHSLALERQVLVVSTQLTLLTTCCEVLLSLLFPMRWSHAYIPLLPRFLCPILNAPMSFLIGIDKQYLGEAFEHLSAECIVVDLDTNQVQVGPSTPSLPKLPTALEHHLKLKLEENAGMIYREARSLRKEDNFSERGQHLLPHVKVMADHMWESKLCLYDEAFHLAFTPEQARNPDFLNGNDGSGLEVNENDPFNPTVPIAHSFPGGNRSRKQSRWDVVQEAFFGVYVELLCKYRRCLVFPSKDEKGSSDGSSNGSGYGGAGFRGKEFLKSQRYDKRLFLEELIKTQMFDEFITKRLYGVSASDISFFDHAIDMFNKRKVRALDTSAHPVLNSTGAPAARQNSGMRPNTAPVESSMKRFMNRVKGSSNAPIQDDEPLLQSARVHRKLKTIVPPEPSAEGLDGDADGEDDLNFGYSYSTFPTKFDRSLFNVPRPMPPAVIAEFARQQDNASQFRRKLKRHLKKKQLSDMADSEKSPEATTFTVFLVAFTAMIGKELVELSENMHECEDERQILATYTTDTADIDSESEEGEEKEAKEEEEANDDDSFRIESRFKSPLSSAKLEEAKATAAAQLNLAFDILDMMKGRGMKTDPVAYKCLIDACGRCGDTGRATRLLTRMHEDGIVADGVVYSCLVSAFSVENTLGNFTSNSSHIPQWANGASAELDWNRLENKAFKMGTRNQDSEEDPVNGVYSRAGKLKNSLSRYIYNRLNSQDEEGEKEQKVNVAEIIGDTPTPTKERFVSEVVANQIGFGENLLEIVYPDISIDTDNERCPKCDTMMHDDEVVAGWSPDPQDYTTTCMMCHNKFVPKFCVQSTSQSFVGSKGVQTPLICERLSPWVLEKELRTKMHDIEGAEDLLDPEWRERENKNSVMWWNLILSFMRYRLPFTFLLQGSFPQDLISPMPSMEEGGSNEEPEEDDGIAES